MSLSLSHTHQLGWVSTASNQKRACFYMAVGAPSKARHHSNYSSEGDKRCQHSILSCKQIMLRGPNDVCKRNKIIKGQFWLCHCGSSASWGSWEEGRWLLEPNPPGVLYCVPFTPLDAISRMLISLFLYGQRSSGLIWSGARLSFLVLWRLLVVFNKSFSGLAAGNWQVMFSPLCSSPERH